MESWTTYLCLSLNVILFKYPSPEWDTVTPEAKNLINQKIYSAMPLTACFFNQPQQKLVFVFSLKDAVYEIRLNLTLFSPSGTNILNFNYPSNTLVAIAIVSSLRQIQRQIHLVFYCSGFRSLCSRP